jgi:periplasmic protein TonB
MNTADPLQLHRPARRRNADGIEGRAARDRLSTMLVLAALLHGLLLLGVTFSAGGGKGDSARGLEVLLVSDELPEAGDNDDASYLAQRSQDGSGNTRERAAAELPGQRPKQPLESDSNYLLQSPEEQLLRTSAPALSTIHVEPAPEPELVLTQAELEQILAGDESLVLRGEQRDELYLSPDTRASRLAPYLDGWRRRIEQVGTLNFPATARHRPQAGSLVLEVVIQSDGKLRRATIERSSGHAELDEAARSILRLASPFAPFPPELARDFQSLRFAYEWRFEDGTASSSLRLP